MSLVYPATALLSIRRNRLRQPPGAKNPRHRRIKNCMLRISVVISVACEPKMRSPDGRASGPSHLDGYQAGLPRRLMTHSAESEPECRRRRRSPAVSATAAGAAGPCAAVSGQRGECAAYHRALRGSDPPCGLLAASRGFPSSSIWHAPEGLRVGDRGRHVGERCRSASPGCISGAPRLPRAPGEPGHPSGTADRAALDEAGAGAGRSASIWKLVS
jgi:hypothetical protein